MKEEKLRVGQTIRIGFAFLSICAFWQLYNNIMPLILTGTFKLGETVSGAIMAADNVLGLFLLPLFGTFSDKCKNKMGRRKPFVLFGTIAAVVLMILIPMIDNSYFANPGMGKKILFIAVLGALLVAMGTYRSPAVALMPDLTPKRYRSQGNAIINLMGAVGGILYLGLAAVLYPQSKTDGMEHVDYMLIFLIVAGIMILALIILMLTVNEAKIMKEMEEYEKQHPEENLAVDDGSGNEVLPPEVKRSLVFLLFSVALWFVSYNAVETWFTKYAEMTWGKGIGGASTCLLIANAGAILSYVPVGWLSGKIGRKKSILGGIVLMTACYIFGLIYTNANDSFSNILYVVFALIGMAWAAINVNSLPMVLEMCKGSDVGKFTGYYYTFSMTAQIITPIFCGFLLEHIGYGIYFIYAAAFMIFAFCTMVFVKHGDAKEGKTGLEAFDVED
ncbi:MAG: MFS transporter [Lachnospiraceae bacterium]|nr:MFS transporter [Lachnospiraceae bacterium]